MLTHLRIKNLALVTDVALDFDPGFNTITGETGAGKSILIGALALLLGERADRTLVRAGAENCSVEALFDLGPLRDPVNVLLAENGLDPAEGDQLILRRIVSQTGNHRQFVNGSPTTRAVLETLGEWLVDIHGPHDHQSLLRPAQQLDVIDAFGRLLPLRAEFTALREKRRLLESEKAACVGDERDYRQQLDLLRFQAAEIQGAQLRPDEESDLEQQHQRARHAARLQELAQTAANQLHDADGSVLAVGRLLGRSLAEMARLDPGAASLLESHQQAISNLNDLQLALSRYADQIQGDPATFSALEERLTLLLSLKRKYGSTLADVIEFGAQAQTKLAQLESRDATLERLTAELTAVDRNLQQLGKNLSRRREKILPAFVQAANEQLAELGFFPEAFSIHFSSASETPARAGFDAVEFLFTPNRGEPARPLRAIASSGELARVMLALKTVLAEHDQVPVLIFDEVDANIGGETAAVVGEKMRRLGAHRQVLCITHLAPVAAAASTHFKVSKEVEAERTITVVEKLARKDRIPELARMLGGQSLAARRHAETMLG